MNSPVLTDLKCPRCSTGQHAPHSRLYAGQGGGMTLHACGVCGGVWLSQACVQRLTQQIPPEAIALASSAAHHARVAADITAQIDCPLCGKQMKRTRAVLAGIDLDSCVGHGTWYDRDEIRLLADALRRSGWAQSPQVPLGAAGGPNPPVPPRGQQPSNVSSGAVEVAAEATFGVFAILDIFDIFS